MSGWLFTSVSGQTSWQSHAGYDDVLGTQYVYDNFVPYSKRVHAGDVILIREGDAVLGVSRIDQIESMPDVKLRRRCPVCKRTGIEWRERTQDWACRHKDCKKRSPNPDDVSEPITKYIAKYATQWQALDGAITYSQLEPWLVGVAQHAIRPCDTEVIEKLLHGVGVSLPETDSPVPNLSIPGGRRLIESRARVGQGTFRAALLRKYGLSCAVTGPCPAEALEAAHLVPFSAHETHDVDNGLLLRSDIHRLFDSGALAINPDTRVIELSAELLNYPTYRDLHGKQISQDPSEEALREAYEQGLNSFNHGLTGASGMSEDKVG